ncbi:hypothetical protein HU720_00660 [Pseudomonas sp. SWRI51]|uniref:hypothetical protein n=1 Tax=Pseudomonas sp. SWRI51 TaxID=2745491 RepID=UPI0016495F2D|nr:hypothetical protein [Pseudomonas sp. SWRI51]MBC3409817.1 hypothetical protein [Pseudomonas sp. SWRI51]
MSFFRKLLAFIAQLFSRKDEPDSDVLPKIDPEKIQKELRVVELARIRGAAGVPSSSATQLSDVEHSIRGKLGEMREQILKYGERSLKSADNRLGAIDVTRDIKRTLALGEEFERYADQDISKMDGELAELRQAAEDKALALDSFREQNKLQYRTADAADRDDKWKSGGLLFAMTVGEGFGNAFLFSEGMSSGYVGGFVTALMLSAFNVLVCFFLGRASTYKNHIKPSRMCAGYFALGAGLISMVIVGLGTAYFRFVLPQLEDESQSAVQLIRAYLQESILPFQDISSCGLFALTVLFGLAAVYKGYTWTDSYPGYAKVYLAYEDAQRRYVFAIEALRQVLEQRKVEYLLLLDQNVERAAAAIQNFKRSMSQKTVIKKVVDERMVLADETLTNLVRKYRIENEMARPSGNAPPVYFDEPVAFVEVTMPDFSTHKDELKLAEQERLMAAMTASLETIRARIQSSFNQKYDQVQPLQQLVSGRA